MPLIAHGHKLSKAVPLSFARLPTPIRYPLWHRSSWPENTAYQLAHKSLIQCNNATEAFCWNARRPRRIGAIPPTASGHRYQFALASGKMRCIT